MSELTRQGVCQALKHWPGPVEVAAQLGSTSTRARELADQGAPHGTLVIADSQTQGRGRQGRSFASPAGTGLYLSLVLRGAGTEQTAQLTCAAAVAVRRAVERTTGVALGIKWVNDLYREGRKCCGILAEAVHGGPGPGYLVLGVGLNLLPPREGWPPELEQIAGSVLEAGAAVDRCEVAAAVAQELLQGYQALPDPQMMEEYRRWSIMPGRQIQILQNGKSWPALAQDITPQGHLQVLLPDGTTQLLSFGEVSVHFEKAPAQGPL